MFLLRISYNIRAAPGSYEICPVCNREDDPVQAGDPNYEGGANPVSLTQARENFRHFGAITEYSLQRVRKSLADEIPCDFTGKERDSESGLDNFGARYYASSIGRFKTRDSHAAEVLFSISRTDCDVTLPGNGVAERNEEL